MKIIATGDWHIGHAFHGYDRTGEHLHFFAWLTRMLAEHRPDALLVAGDIYDNANPSAAAQSTFYEFLVEAHKTSPDTHFIITAGNHDSAARLEAPAPLMASHNIEVRGVLQRLPARDGQRGEIDLDSLLIPITSADGMQAVIAAVPFIRPDVVTGTYARGVRKLLEDITRHARRKYPDTTVVMMAHMYASGAEIAAQDHSERVYVGGQEEVSLSGWESAPDYFTCGHIHKRQRISGLPNARYTGSVLPMSFAEINYHHSVDLIEILAAHEPVVTHLEYTPQHRLKILSNAGLTRAKFKKLICTELPARGADGNLSSEFIYVALELNVDEITPDERRELETLVTERDAVLCAVRAVKNVDSLTSFSDERPAVTLDEIINRPAIDTLREAFISRHNEEPDDDILAMLDEIVKSVELNHLKENESD
ncbi:MAG: exonuclease subunit SbcD [Muribaculaceae bacterium]|nr:exonuclease subunit SbcD [Muribaculaceae bacterium]